MNYDLTIKDERRKFLRYANMLMRKQRSNVSLIDESNRTLNQNSYIHVLCRIMAEGTGTTEQYAKQVYFKELANKDIFVRITKDPLTNSMVKTIRSTCDLTISEMRKAIYNFRTWAAENGYDLPEANINDDGSMAFATAQDQQAYHQAIINTSKTEQYL